LAFMRGRTLNDSFVILDEAQNTTSEQMKMFLTRLGFGSKTVITGDITQVDLPLDKISGLIEAENILRKINRIRFVHFSELTLSGTRWFRMSLKLMLNWTGKKELITPDKYYEFYRFSNKKSFQ
jgi:Phosphate starvation-inducible protein PhoH, predicted ATPase